MVPTGSSFRLPRVTPVVKATLLLLLGSFVASALAVRFSSLGESLYSSLALVPHLVVGPPWRVWTLLTYALLHSLDSPVHLLFNGMVFYFFGPTLEDRWGARKFVLLMLFAAVGGGLAVVLTYLAGLSTAAVVGASAVTAGLTIAWGFTYRDAEVFLFLFRIKGIQLVYGLVVLELLNALSLSGTSAAAHFGGMAVGLFYGESSPVRRAWLKYRLGRLQREARGPASGKRRPRADGSLRVIRGGGDEPPRDKRYLN